MLRDAVAGADAIDAPYERVKARRLLAAALQSGRRERDEVGALLVGAADLASEHGFVGEQQLVAELAANLAVT